MLLNDIWYRKYLLAVFYTMTVKLVVTAVVDLGQHMALLSSGFKILWHIKSSISI